MRGGLLFSLIVWLSSAGVAKASLTVELMGCSEGFAADKLARAVEHEAPGAPADQRLMARFDCETKGQVALEVHGPQGQVLAVTLVELASLPEHARPRMLAVVWAELIRALSLEGGVHEADTQPEAHASSPAKPALDDNGKVLASQTSMFSRPATEALASASADGDSARSRFAHRASLTSWPPVQANLFGMQAGFALLHFLRANDALLGANFGARMGPVSVLGFYAQHPSEPTPLGDIDARTWGGALELALWCGAFHAFELCAIASSDVGRAEVEGRATPTVSASDALATWFGAGALGMAARTGKRWLAFELSARAGLAHGPTARVQGETVVALHGGFLGLTLSAVVEP